MAFNTYVFVLLFLPLVILLYYLFSKVFNDKYSNYLLIIASMVFITYGGGILSLCLIIISSIINYLIYRKLINIKSKKYLIIGIIFDVLLLCVFKYKILFQNDLLRDVIMPLGISFYTFQEIAFLVDTYRGEVSKYSLFEYLSFVLFFPKLLQGPIVYHNELLPQLSDSNKKKLNIDNFSKGIYVFSIGLAKKVLVANIFEKIVEYGYTHISSLNGYEALLVILAYTIQIYCDFSGYTDMAIGCGLMLNIELPFNFNSPYKAKNISEFWSRWHITLTRFLTKYIYIPLGGNRKGEIRTYINTLIVFIVSGLWHGVGYTFVVWGLLHALTTILYKKFKNLYEKIPSFIQWLLTFVFISITWVFFRSSSINQAIGLLKQVFVGTWNFSINSELTESLLQPTLLNIYSQLIPFNIVIILIFVFTIVIMITTKNSNVLLKDFKPNYINWIIVYLLLVISILSFSGVSGFLYVNF